MDIKNVFSLNLNKYMKLKGKTRNDISTALGISYFTVSDWVNGKKYPRMDKVEMLANYFGVQKSDLIEDRSEEKKPTAEDELSEGKKKLIEFAMSVPEDKIDRILQVMKLIAEAD